MDNKNNFVVIVLALFLALGIAYFLKSSIEETKPSPQIPSPIQQGPPSGPQEQKPPQQLEEDEDSPQLDENGPAIPQGDPQAPSASPLLPSPPPTLPQGLDHRMTILTRARIYLGRDLMKFSQAE